MFLTSFCSSLADPDTAPATTTAKYSAVTTDATAAYSSNAEQGPIVGGHIDTEGRSENIDNFATRHWTGHPTGQLGFNANGTESGTC